MAMSVIVACHYIWLELEGNNLDLGLIYRTWKLQLDKSSMCVNGYNRRM